MPTGELSKIREHFLRFEYLTKPSYPAMNTTKRPFKTLRILGNWGKKILRKRKN